MATEVLLDGLAFGEAPRWREDRLWFSDFYRRAVYTVDLDGNERKVVDVPNQPSGLGWLPDGRLLVVSMVDRTVLRREPDGSLVTHADLAGLATYHANDMLVDGAGRAYVGNFGYDLHADLAARDAMEILADEQAGLATLARVDPDGTVHRAAEGLRFPNGTVLVGETTLVVAETLRLCLTAFDIEPGGTLTNRRVWAPTGFVAPDGTAAAPDGTIWVSNGLAPQVVRFAEGGDVLQEVETSQIAYACALGGPGGRTLFAMTAPSSDPRDVDGRNLGRIEVARV